MGVWIACFVVANLAHEMLPTGLIRHEPEIPRICVGRSGEAAESGMIARDAEATNSPVDEARARHGLAARVPGSRTNTTASQSNV
jgi:hypothetical protein